jgi:hypothetical protein
MPDVQVIVYRKGPEQYWFLFAEANRREVLRQLGRFAANPELAFNWMDAGAVAAKMNGSTDAAITLAKQLGVRED